MSRAVVFNGYGDPDVLQVIEAEPPDPGPGQVRVRVKAAGIQPFDCLFRSGRARQWIPARFPQRLGNDFAGVVDAVGSDVGEYRVGDEVLGWAILASHAAHVIAGVDEIVRRPPSMPWEEAGAVSASGQTAATALRLLGVGDGETVLIHGSTGGVGSFAVQIATARGARVIGTASARNHEYLRSLGTIPLAYGDGLVDRVRQAAPSGVDAALDTSGTIDALHASLELVTDKNRIGTVAYQPEVERLGVRHLSTERSAEQLRELAELYTSGKLRISIQNVYPLERAADAHRTIETGHVRGKIVLTP